MGEDAWPRVGGDNKNWFLTCFQKTIKSNAKFILAWVFSSFFLSNCCGISAVATECAEVNLPPLHLRGLLRAAALHQKSISSVDHRSGGPRTSAINNNCVSSLKYRVQRARASLCEDRQMCLAQCSGFIQKAAILPVSSAQLKPPTGSSRSTCGSICLNERAPLLRRSRSDLVEQRSQHLPPAWH